MVHDGELAFPESKILAVLNGLLMTLLFLNLDDLAFPDGLNGLEEW